MVLLFLLSIFSWHFVSLNAALCNYSAPCALKGGEALRRPSSNASVNGSLFLTLNVEVGNFTVDWLTLQRRTYNGIIPSPTWKVKRGDVVQLQLNNNLDHPEKEEPFNSLRLPNTTNIHTHGLHVSPKQPSDDVMLQVRPGENYTYTFKIGQDHPTGTFWFHPHAHGSTLFQLHSGMAGMIIVEDEEKEVSEQLRSVSCPWNCQHDLQLIFQPLLVYAEKGTGGKSFSKLQQKIGDRVQNLAQHNVTSAGTTFEEWMVNTTNGIDYFTTNGQLHPLYKMKSGQIKRFRMLNAGGNANLEIELVNSRDKHSCEVREIAADGVYFDQPRKQTKSDHRTFMAAGNRIDWLVACRKPGKYTLRSNPTGFDEKSMGDEIKRFKGDLLTLKVTGNRSKKTVFNPSLPPRPSYMRDFRNFSQDNLNGFFAVEFSPAEALNRETFSRSLHYRYHIEVGKRQEWYFLNTDCKEAHPIHLHVNQFQVISYNKYTGPFGVSGENNSYEFFDQNGTSCFYQHPEFRDNQDLVQPPDPLHYLGHDEKWAKKGKRYLGYADAGEFRDTLLVPPLANITIRFMPHTFTGDLVVYVLDHEDKGMMMVVEMVDKLSYDANITAPSDVAYPGTCHKCDPFPFHKNMSDCWKKCHPLDKTCNGSASKGFQRWSYLEILTLEMVFLLYFH